MSNAASMIHAARTAAGLTQLELAERLGVTQPAISALEHPQSNPRIATLEAALAATGHRLQLIAPQFSASVDVSLISRHLKDTVEERITALERMHHEVAALSGSLGTGR